ncbi:unnamed protein product [Owenia fusiformis]|uniref:Uncharacterized protein n=1 Tax=Owenia fusiformis TaxID=6347 RepID=A0A8J1XZX6_OWEFU|nr:unnamed protein product [Owenia fusiformis]
MIVYFIFSMNIHTFSVLLVYTGLGVCFPTNDASEDNRQLALLTDIENTIKTIRSELLNQDGSSLEERQFTNNLPEYSEDATNLLPEREEQLATLQNEIFNGLTDYINYLEQKRVLGAKTMYKRAPPKGFTAMRGKRTTLPITRWDGEPIE